MYLKQVDIESILDSMQGMPPANDEVFLLFLAEQSQPDLTELVNTLKAEGLHFMGGVFPGVIHQVLHREGAVILRVPTCGKPRLIRDLDQMGSQPLGTLKAPQPSEKCPTGCPTALVLVDGLAPNLAPFLDALRQGFGSSVHYVGGGCGSMSLRQEPCLFTEDGVFKNAALVLMMPLGSSIGIQHGWRRLTGPLTATQTDRNTIRLLNGRPAVEVYREIVEKDSGRSLAAGGFYDMAKEYPFGIVMNSDEDLVRDPIAMGPNGELICIGEVPQGTALNVLKGQKSALIAAAGRAAGYLCRKAPAYRQCLVFDCVSRALFLDQAYAKELDMVHNSLHMIDQKLIAKGALSLGEIASTAQQDLKFFNKTTVVAGLFDRG